MLSSIAYWSYLSSLLRCLYSVLIISCILLSSLLALSFSLCSSSIANWIDYNSLMSSWVFWLLITTYASSMWSKILDILSCFSSSYSFLWLLNWWVGRAVLDVDDYLEVLYCYLSLYFKLFISCWYF